VTEPLENTAGRDVRYQPALRVEAARLYKPLAEGGEGLSVRGVAERMGVSVRRAWELLQDAQSQGLVELRHPGGQPDG
jgi:DNA-binding transcriptional regulator LsrR (DeoR family)